jgi:hypothetical protein
MLAKKEINWININDSQPNDNDLVLVYGQEYNSESNHYKIGLVYWNHNLLADTEPYNIIGVHQIKDYAYDCLYYYNVTHWTIIKNPK